MAKHFKKNLGHWNKRTKRTMQHIGNGRRYWSLFKEGSLAYQIHSQTSVMDTGEPEIGSLVLVPCEMWLTANGGGPRGSTTNLPIIGPDAVRDAPGLRFVVCDPNGLPKIRPAVKPVLQLACVKDIEGYLSITKDEFVESSLMTKMWDTINRAPGLFRYDYVLKTDPNNLFSSSRVDLYMLAWQDQDTFSVIPGIIERRPRKHWFQTEIVPGIYKADKEVSSMVSSEVDLPLVGTLGTVIGKKLMTHGFDDFGCYVAGTEVESWFYKILFPRREPVWVFGPVWKCPEELILPIYLPIS